MLAAHASPCLAAVFGANNFDSLIRYTLADIQPSCGPWSGGTDVVVVGEGLVSSSAAAAKFVVAKAEGAEEGGGEWSSVPMKCVYDAATSSLKFVTCASEAIGVDPSSAKLHFTLDGATWKETPLAFNLYSQLEWAEPKPKAFVVGTRGGALLLPPAAGTCVTSASVTVRFVCGSLQLEEVGSSDAAGVTVQAPDFAEAGDYTVLGALNGQQVNVV